MKFETLIYFAISSVIILIFIVIGNLIAPATPSERVKTVHYVDNISDAHKKIIELFNKQYKGEIVVEPIDLPFEKFSTNQRKELLVRYLRSKSDRIDIFSVDQIWVPKFAKWAINFQDYFNTQKKDDLTGFAANSCYFNNSLVALPLYVDIAVMYYREDLLKKNPDFKTIKDKLENSITWEDFVRLQKTYNKNDFFFFQADNYEGLTCLFAEMLAGQGKSFIQENKISLETPEAEKALTLLCNLVKKRISPRDVSYLREDQSRDMFLSKDAFFLRGWPATISKKDLDNIRIVPTPHFQGGNPCSIYGGWNLMISKNSSNIPEAIKFIKFLMRDDCQKLLYESGGYLPANKNIYNDTSFTNKHPELKFYYRLLTNGSHRPFLKNYSDITEILSYFLNMAIKEEITPKEALHKASEKIKALGVFN